MYNLVPYWICSLTPKYLLSENFDSYIALQSCGLGLLDNYFSKCGLETTCIRIILNVCRCLDCFRLIELIFWGDRALESALRHDI